MLVMISIAISTDPPFYIYIFFNLKNIILCDNVKREPDHGCLLQTRLLYLFGGKYMYCLACFYNNNLYSYIIGS